MPRSVTFETYTPALIADSEFLPAVTTLVRDHLDVEHVKGVVTRRNDRLIPLVSNNTIVFPDPRYYFGRLIAPAGKHNPSKLADIRNQLENEGVYGQYSGKLLDMLIGEIDTTEIVTGNGLKTLLVAKTVIDECTKHGSELADYTNEVVSATNNKLHRRPTLRDETFDTLKGTVPLASLGATATTEIDINQLVRNMNELVGGEPIHGLAEMPEDGLTTRLAE